MTDNTPMRGTQAATSAITSQDDEQVLAPGDRVEPVTVSEDYLRFALTAGDHGTVEFTDSLGTVHIRWDSGTRIGIIAEARDMIRSERAAGHGD